MAGQNIAGTFGPAAVELYALDHPRMARTLAARVEKRRLQLQAELANGNAEDWPDYKERVGVIRGLQEAIDIAGELAKDMEHN